MTADETKTLYMFDIETEGLAAFDNRVTVIGFKEYGPTGKHTIYYLDELDEGEVTNKNITASSTVDLRPVESEKELFIETFNFIDNNDINNPNNASIVGFNSSKFDIQFLRTRVLFNHLGEECPDWIFTDVKHLDVFKTIKYEFNTKGLKPINGIQNLNKPKIVELEQFVFGEQSGRNLSPIKADLENNKDKITTEAMEYLITEFDDVNEEDFIGEINDLDGVYDEMINDEHYTIIDDPFEDSKEAVTAFKGGDVESVIQHNVSDLERTDAIVWLIINAVAGEKSKLSTIQSIMNESL